MLNIFRKRQSLVRGMLWVILLLVCVGMVVTLIPGITGDTGDSANNPVVAEVSGEKITEFEVQQSVQQVSQRNKIPSEMMPFYTNQILNEMVLQKASLKEAERLGLTVDEAELTSLLKRDQNLFPNGKFIGQQQYEDMVSQNFGVSVAQFEDKYRQAILIDKLRMLVTDTVSVNPEEVHKAFVAENEKVVLDYVSLLPGDFKKDIKPSDSDLDNYYKTNKARYQSPEKRVAKLLFLDKTKMKEGITASDTEIKKYYQDHLESFRNPERVTVQHILFKADTKNPAELEKARTKAQDLLAKLKGGADFTALAKQFSEDTGTAQTGGYLANVVRKQTVPEFEAAAFSLAPGALSDLVQTVYGIHIIKVITHDQAHLQTLDEAKVGIGLVVQDNKVTKAVEEASNLAFQAVNQKPTDLTAIAEKYRMEVVSPAPFPRNESLPRIGSAEGFMQEVFGLEKNHAGQPFQTNDGYVVPFLIDIIAAHPSELAEVKEQLKTDYIDDQSKEKAAAKARELAKLLEPQASKDLKKAAKSLGLTVKTSAALARDGVIPSIASAKDLDPKTFSMPVGAVAGPIILQGGQLVYQIASKEPANEQEFAAKKSSIQDKLLNERRKLAFEVFQDSLRKKLTASGDLKFHQDAVAKLTSVANPNP